MHSFLSGVLSSKDASVLLTSLQIAEMLMQKLPDVFQRMFVKEGVVHAIDLLIASENNSSPQQSSVSAKCTDISGVSPAPPVRSRRGGAGKRRGVPSNDPTGEEPGASTALVGSPPVVGGMEPSVRNIRSGLRATAIASAKRFKELYFSADSGVVDAGMTESLFKLKDLCARLSNESVIEVKGKGKGKGKVSQLVSVNDERLLGLLREVLAELGSGDGVSTFEFVGSGVVSSLLQYFSCGSLAKENLVDPSASKIRQQALKRSKQFIGISLPMGSKESEVPLTMLVQKLQNALASLERFPVVLSHAPRSSSGSASIAAGLSALTQPFKLRLSRGSGEKVLRDYSTNVVLIEPLATLVAVEDFLWPRVKRHETPSTSAANNSDGGDPARAVEPAPAASPTPTAPVIADRRPSTRSRTAAAIASASASASAASASAASASASASAIPSAAARRYLEAAGSTTSAKGKGKVCNKNSVVTRSPEEHRGPETRNAAARRRAEAAEASLLKQAEGASGASVESEVCVSHFFPSGLPAILSPIHQVACASQDEEVDASPVELEEAVAMEEDEISEDEDEEEEQDEVSDFELLRDNLPLSLFSSALKPCDVALSSFPG